jgi:hypothetical protein
VHVSFRDVRRAGAAPAPTTRRWLRRAVTATTRSHPADMGLPHASTTHTVDVQSAARAVI